MSTVLLTGASGFIAGHILKLLLEKGYTVKATVRSQDKADYLKKLYPVDAKLSFVIVPDIAAPNAFDEAVIGSDYVLHTASPFHFRVTDPVKDLLDPALKGTGSILNAIKKNGPQVKKLVVTSSFAAIVDSKYGARPGYTYSEADWNPVTWEEAIGNDPSTTYRASKTFAEKSVWDFLEKEKPGFTVTTINPPLVWGPMIHNVTKESINTSNANIYSLINGSLKTVPNSPIAAWVDVRNVAEAHVFALEKPASDNQRYFVTAGTFNYNDIVKIIREKFPEIKDKVPVPSDEPRAPSFNVDNSKSIRDLGLEYISLEQSIFDLVKQIVEWV
ncbi:hypothetical protein V1511DRAFT_499613 [Dipodascopsis uninucleata]